ncbi:unnamed protein product [Trichogramma brassicae]|uniref:Uncharacterized protein n=1 Tax=Trichogramma brassicae TaxID=86971 RepID=A0A6H5INB7_9HYME|nr:unnamed protein product [Trichogramma brassicae]
MILPKSLSTVSSMQSRQFGRLTEPRRWTSFPRSNLCPSCGRSIYDGPREQGWSVGFRATVHRENLKHCGMMVVTGVDVTDPPGLDLLREHVTDKGQVDHRADAVFRPRVFRSNVSVHIRIKQCTCDDRGNKKNDVIYGLSYQALVTGYLTQIQKYIDGTTPRPTAAADVDDWEQKDAEAQAFLMRGLELDQLRYLTDCSTAADMWSRLRTIHAEKSDQSVQHDKQLELFSDLDHPRPVSLELLEED